MKILRYVAAASALIMIAVTGTVQAGATFNAVKKRGYVQCGVNTGLPGFSNPDDKGHWKGLDVDVCRAVAAAMFGDASKVRYTPLTAKERFTALQSGEIDILSRNTTWTLTRDASLGLNFAGVNYYDGQGFMVKKSLGVTSAKQLGGASICVQSGTTTELNLADYFRSHHMKFTPITFDTPDATVKAFDAGRCDVLTSDRSQLYALRIQLTHPDGAEVLPAVISKEPLGPVVRQGDDEWFNLVKWSLFAMIDAEGLGITSQNAAELRKDSKNPGIQRFLGVTGGFGKMLGVSNNWAYNIITQVGNYGQSFERNVGMDSPLKIKRGLNALWKNGGIQYAPPLR